MFSVHIHSHFLIALHPFIAQTIEIMVEKKEEKFEEIDATEKSGLLREFVLFLMHNKKYWMTPIILVLLLFGLLILLGGSAAAPFIYTLF